MTNAERQTTGTFEPHDERPRTTDFLRDLEPRHDVRGGYAPLFSTDERDTARSFTADLVR